MEVVLTAAGLAAALVAGVFLGFSDFVMRGLAQADGKTGAAGMVGLNRTVYRSVFMVLLMGLAPAAAVLSAVALASLEGSALVLTLAGAAAYLAGVMAVTGLGNVPMNTRLDRLSRTPDGAGEYWAEYVRGWTRLNHIRVAGSVFAAVAWITAAHLA